jgi:arylsulfatase A
MLNRDFCRIIALTLLLLPLAVRAEVPDDRPNIVFIMADDLGYGHLGCYGQEIIQTPNIDRLAGEGMRFTQAYAGCSVCAPSRNSLMTGQHTGHVSVRGNGGGVSLQPNDTTVAQLLKKAGYQCALFGKWGLGEQGTPGIPMNKGFDEFFGYLHQLHAQFYYPAFLWHNQEKVYFPENAAMKRGTYAPDLILQQALNFVRDNRNRLFFLYLPVTLPHHEFIAPDETLDMYRGKFEEFPIAHWRDGYALPAEPRATFAAMVTHLDKEVGRLLTLLDELALNDHTIVFFVSDNGAAHGPLENAEFFKANGELRGYKGSLYEGGIRVPMIVRWPGHIKAKTESDFVTYFPDILPTLSELAQISAPLPQNIDGISIVSILLDRGKQVSRPYLYWEDGEYERTPPYQLIRDSFMQAVRMGKWKAVKNSPADPLELYNLDLDEQEKTDLAATHTDIVNQIRTLMDQSHRDAPPQLDMTHQQAAKLYIPRESSP